MEIRDAPEGDYTAIAGLVLAVLGRIPEPGDRVERADWTIEVTSIDGNAITGLRLRPPQLRRRSRRGAVTGHDGTRGTCVETERTARAGCGELALEHSDVVPHWIR
ncbi:MAG TPA: transporter associated domain-containing protein [Actinophytocola sp.]|uniref:transporter associated domain-containing protein n=1 Tax=Actinophytocola sp. TaxID=1872138 RepID=UPI002DDD1040|nr:transporter associated domain-containing protein [Actinophytocola sp.]HEV2777976.1 transporter associated domain-containing protein [Actinophytocola sp.]